MHAAPEYPARRQAASPGSAAAVHSALSILGSAGHPPVHSQREVESQPGGTGAEPPSMNLLYRLLERIDDRLHPPAPAHALLPARRRHPDEGPDEDGEGEGHGLGGGHRPRQHVRRRSTSTRRPRTRASSPSSAPRPTSPARRAAPTAPSASSNHLILLAKNDEGYRNLRYLSSMAFLEGLYYNPRIDKELLKDRTKGLFAFTACLGGEVPSALMRGDMRPRAQARRSSTRSIFEPATSSSRSSPTGWRCSSRSTPS